ncbi:MAG: bifunctional DNA-formamidopyrimidine glycosylase/DNA-(apurinic or apyrimidinic site) lyase [Alphaproteobacteria bacterium]
MPELPEVETIRRGMENAMLGKTFKAIQIRRHDLRVPIPKNLGQVMTGHKLNTILRRGKYIIAHLSNDTYIILHLGMSGRIHISNEDKPPLKHDHVIMYMNDDTRISFEDPRRFGMFYLSSTKNWEDEKPFSNMGPEPLNKDCTGNILFNRLKSKTAPIKSALLDQRVIAGLGNIYVCEALYRANIHPQKPCSQISHEKINALMPHIKDILNEAIKSGGSSLKDYKHTDGSLGYFQHGFKVYDQENQKCQNKACNENIVRITQSGRSTFFCPNCQT